MPAANTHERKQAGNMDLHQQQVDKFAAHEFGWNEAEFGNSVDWLADMRNMLSREVQAVNKNLATARSYGYTDEQEFISINNHTISKINKALYIR